MNTRRITGYCLLIILLTAGFSCGTSDQKSLDATKVKVPEQKEDTVVAEKQERKMADAATILARKQVPVLCYHHIRDLKPGQKPTFSSYSVTPVQFASQMKALKDSGYETILPDQLYDYLVYDEPLPPRPVMITFDDTNGEQFTIGAKEMEKYGFKGTYFIMTISIGRPRYMTREEIKELADNGHAVESHTWDHTSVKKYKGEDFDKQLVKPRKTIEDITGKPAIYFAYPFGLWDKAIIPELKKAGFKMAFALSGKRDSTDPLFTVRRLIVSGTWSTPGVMNTMQKTFERD